MTASPSSSQIDKDVKNDLHRIRQHQEQTSLEIEKSFESEYFEVINEHQKASQILVELAKSVKSEALILLPRDKSMVRLDRLQIFDHIIKSSQKNNNAAVVKIICPLSQINAHIVKRISDCASSNIKIINGNNSPYGMFIVDNQKLLRAELRKPDAEDLSEAIGYTIYSTSKASANSFKSVFELLWAELILNEELKRAGKMQKEFINIAAHELRTPAQSILGYAELANTDQELCKHDKQGILGAIYRNAIRLQRLTRSILDVTKIESNALELHKQVFNLNDVIANVVSDFKTHTANLQKGKLIIKYDSSSVSTIYNNDNSNEDNKNNKNDNAIFIEADKERIAQLISNILDNTIKFTKANLSEGEVEAINIDTQENDYHAIVSIMDAGTGIDPWIMPRLFEKFATKSLTGTGLGLFISKSIVEAHGGKIWAENNPNDRGATFTFSLPLAKQ